MSENRLSFSELETILIAFSTLISETTTEEEVAWALAKNCISKLGFEDCVIYYVDNQVLIQKAAYGPKNPKDYEIYDPIAIAIGSGISGHAAQSGMVEIVADTSKDARYIQDDSPRMSEIAVPIQTGNKIMGVIDCEHSSKGFFTEQHGQILSAIAAIAAIKIDSIRKREENKIKENELIAAQKEMLALQSRALRAQMNPHFVFNSLNAIQHFITTNDKINALKYLSLFSKLIRYYLLNLEAEFVDLNSELTMLEWYLQLQKLRYEDRFNYTFEKKINQNKNNNPSIPALVLPMLLENAVEQAVSDDSKIEILSVRIEVQTEQVAFEVQFNKKKVLYQEVDYRDKIPAWENQVELLNKLKPYKIEKSIEMTSSNNANGVRINVVLPIQ